MADLLELLRELPAILEGHPWAVPGFTGWAWDCSRAVECYVGWAAPLGRLVVLP